MQAAVLEQFGTSLGVREVPEPQVAPGQVVVEVLATCVLPYTSDVLSGARRYPLETPVVPGVGAVGSVLSVGPDATTLHAGDVVWCDPTVRARDGWPTPDITLQGWSSRGEGGLRLSRYFHDGPLAERMAVPTENVVPLGIDAVDAAGWAGMSVPLVPYGGLRAVDLQAGESVLVSGATGNFGSAGVAVALAMGAAVVVVAGRNRAVLDDLVRRFGRRVRPVVLGGDAAAGEATILAAAGPVDVVLDLLPPEAPAAAVRAAVMCVRPGGRVVLMGGVGMLGGEDLSLPYPWLMRNAITVRGQWMLEPQLGRGLFALARCGLLDLSQDTVTTFGLQDVDSAVAHAAAHRGPFMRTVVTPIRTSGSS